MISQILFFIILAIGLFCNPDRQESSAEISVARFNKTELHFLGYERKKVNHKIRFDFTAERIKTDQETIAIKASLFNGNADTVYFLSSTCNGEQFSLRYDTAKFILTPFLNCNASYPIIIKIAPQRQHDFQADFKSSSKEKQFKLGFDFYSVDKTFKLTNKNLGDVNIFNRPEDKQTILWADEKAIK